MASADNSAWFGWDANGKPQSFPITQGFGCTGVGAEPAANGCAHYHNGIDIAAPGGAKVVSGLGEGKVATVGWDPGGYGNYVTVAYKDGVALFGHLSSVNVKQGDTLNRGDQIGSVGSTGNSSGNHLHFAWFTGSNPNPNNYGSASEPSGVLNVAGTGGTIPGSSDSNPLSGIGNLGSAISGLGPSIQGTTSSFLSGVQTSTRRLAVGSGLGLLALTLIGVGVVAVISKPAAKVASLAVKSGAV